MYDFNLRVLALKLQSPISQQIERGIFKKSQMVTAVAKWVADALQPYGLEPANIPVTGNGFELSFSSHPENGKKPLILYVGRLEVGKGLEDLVEAAILFIRQSPHTPYRFVIVGKGPLQKKLQYDVKNLGLAPYFDMQGHISQERRKDLIQLYKSAAMFVQPSHHEGMSTVILEAMASGLPVIATNVGGAPEVIRDRVNGFLVPIQKPEALASAIEYLAGDAGIREAMGRNARKTMLEKYSWEAVGQKYIECYRTVLAGAE